MSDKVSFESVGPFHEYRLVVDGFRVPHMTGRVVDGRLHLCCDNRFGCDIPEADATSVVWFIANAMAVAAGYNCFGENSKPANEFHVRFGELALSDVSPVDVESEATS